MDMDIVRSVILGTPVFPYLWLPHCILACVGLRRTLGPSRWKSFSREHPLSCLILALLYIYPGGILTSFVLGENLLSFLTNSPNLYAALASWYLVFYSPWDLVVRVLETSRLLPFLAIPQDWQRVGLVYGGLKLINGDKPAFFLYPVIFGILRSSGFMLVKYIEVGIMNGLKTGFRVPNQATKTMVLAAVLLQLQDYAVWIQRVPDSHLESLCTALNKLIPGLEKAEARLELDELEHAAQLTLQEDEEEGVDTLVTGMQENLVLQRDSDDDSSSDEDAASSSEDDTDSDTDSGSSVQND